jgi:hypothetical protein
MLAPNHRVPSVSLPSEASHWFAECPRLPRAGLSGGRRKERHRKLAVLRRSSARDSNSTCSADSAGRMFQSPAAAPKWNFTFRNDCFSWLDRVTERSSGPWPGTHVGRPDVGSCRHRNVTRRLAQQTRSCTGQTMVRLWCFRALRTASSERHVLSEWPLRGPLCGCESSRSDWRGPEVARPRATSSRS